MKYAGRVIADTTGALTLREAGYAPVHYIPLRDADMTATEPSAHTTYCPYKGDCSYYSLVVGDKRVDHVVGPTATPMPRLPGSRIIWRSIRTASTASLKSRPDRR